MAFLARFFIIFSVNETATSNLLGKGIYTVPDAARLCRVSSRRIRYWLKDLRSEKSRESYHHPLWRGELAPIDDKLALGFHDLQEVRFVDAFLKAGVSWNLMREAHTIAKRKTGKEHPFCTRQFFTDGSYIIQEIIGNETDVAYEEVIEGQRVFPKIILQFLKELEFSDNDELVRWWPLGTNRSIVLDPQRQFGQPITASSGVSTEILQAAAKAGQSVEEIADWYELDAKSVLDAIEFELALAA